MKAEVQKQKFVAPDVQRMEDLRAIKANMPIVHLIVTAIEDREKAKEA